MVGRDVAARTEEVNATELDSASRAARLLPRRTRKRLRGTLRRRKRPSPRLSIRAIRPSLRARVRQIGPAYDITRGRGTTLSFQRRPKVGVSITRLSRRGGRLCRWRTIDAASRSSASVGRDGAGDGARTRDILLGKQTLCQLSYSRSGDAGSLSQPRRVLNDGSGISGQGAADLQRRLDNSSGCAFHRTSSLSLPRLSAGYEDR